MWTAYILVAMVAGSPAPLHAGRAVAVPVRVAFVDGQCRYWNTDVGLNKAQLEEHLGRIADKSLRIEMWLDTHPPEQCVVEAVSAAYRVGFRGIVIRPKTAKDMLGDPPR